MRDKVKVFFEKRNERKIITILSIFIIIGLFFNYKLIGFKKTEEKQIMISTEEKELIKSIHNKNIDESKEFEEEYLQKIDELKSKNKNEKSNEELGKIYYYLGLNRQINNDNEKTIEYYKKSIEHLQETSNYYYLLITHRELMNNYMRKSNQIEGLNHANEIYSILKTKNIQGISENEQDVLTISVLSSIITSSSNFKMSKISSQFYDELNTLISNKPEIEDNLGIYARFQYNFDMKNYKEAKKCAIEYIKYFEDREARGKATWTDVGGAHIYLLELLARTKEVEEYKEVLGIVKKTYDYLDVPIYNAYLDKVQGFYYEGIGDYEKSILYFNKAIEKFNNIDGGIAHVRELNQKIISYYDKVDIDLDKYVNDANRYDEEYKYVKTVGGLSDAIVKGAYKDGDEESNKIKREKEIAKEINKISKVINSIYILIIGLLLIMVKMTKDEIHRKREKEKELELMIKTDYLTKAYSKQYSFNKIQENIDNNRDFLLVLFDLDNFKLLNDKYGHVFGDEVLVNVVEATKEVISEYGEIGRFGGEEFIIVIYNKCDIHKLIEKVQISIANIKLTNSEVNVTISGGAKKWNGESINELLKQVDLLLYEAKAQGKDKIIIDDKW